MYMARVRSTKSPDYSLAFSYDVDRKTVTACYGI